MKNYQVMLFNGIVLICLGIYNYLTGGTEVKLIYTLIIPATGLILILLSIPAAKGKSIPVYIAFVLTIFSVILFFYLRLNYSNSIYVLCGVTSLISLFYYISNFIKRKGKQN
jgi:hypothetical protein